MNPGLLTQRIEVEKFLTTVDDSGGMVNTWVKERSTWARPVYSGFSDGTTEHSDAKQTEVSRLFRVRSFDARDIVPTRTRLCSQPGKMLWTVLAVTPFNKDYTDVMVKEYEDHDTSE